MCMLCSVNEHGNRSATRNRKVSSSSLRRCRTGRFNIIIVLFIVKIQLKHNFNPLFFWLFSLNCSRD